MTKEMKEVARQLREVADLVETLDGDWYAPSFSMQIDEAGGFEPLAKRVRAGEIDGLEIDEAIRPTAFRHVNLYPRGDLDIRFTCMEQSHAQEIAELRERLARLESEVDDD